MSWHITRSPIARTLARRVAHEVGCDDAASGWRALLLCTKSAAIMSDGLDHPSVHARMTLAESALMFAPPALLMCAW